MSVGGQLHAPAALPPGKRPGTHCIGGWVGPRAGLTITFRNTLVCNVHWLHCDVLSSRDGEDTNNARRVNKNYSETMQEHDHFQQTLGETILKLEKLTSIAVWRHSQTIDSKPPINFIYRTAAIWWCYRNPDCHIFSWQPHTQASWLPWKPGDHGNPGMTQSLNHIKHLIYRFSVGLFWIR
jgi:hypothetical protein